MPVKTLPSRGKYDLCIHVSCLSAAKGPKDYNNHLYKITRFVKSLEQQWLQTSKFKVLTTQFTFLNDLKFEV